MSIEKAVRFLKLHGDELQKYRAQFHFSNLRDDNVPLNYYRRKQNPDGGFPHDMKHGNPTSNSETCGALGILAELDLQTQTLPRLL